ncbi:MAG: iron uptake porin [Cyanobacteria bacterium J06638_38]
MLHLWSKFNRIAMLSATCLVFLTKSEVKAIAESTNNNLNWHRKINTQNIHRQPNSSNNSKAHIFRNNDLVTQMNRVDQLKDLSPTDWSYQALQDLAKRYGCNGEFREQDVHYKDIRSSTPSSKNDRREQSNYISRSKFAVQLNACLNRIETIIANSQNIPHGDVKQILRLMQEFQSDLALLQGRTDGSQARLQDLEATQFSTTSKLRGEAIFALGSILTGNDDDSTILGSRLRLELETSFNGEDVLFTRLSRTDFSSFEAEIGTFQGGLSFAENTDSDFRLDTLSYSFSVGDRLDFIFGAAGLEGNDIAPTINFLDGDGASGSISAFGTRNPLYYPPGNAGLGVTHSPIEQIKISAGYLASAANEPSSGNGLFAGPHSVLGQIIITPLESLSLAATYVHSFNQSDTETGTSQANLQSRTADLFGTEIPTVSNSYGLEISWAINPRLIIGGWGGLSKVSNLSTLDQPIDRGTQDIWNWAATLALPDLGKEGSLGGIVIGSEPTVTNSTISNLDADSDRSLHLEAFYQYQVNDNIAITPGVVWITEPDGDIQDADDLVIGTVRTTFSF